MQIFIQSPSGKKWVGIWIGSLQGSSDGDQGGGPWPSSQGLPFSRAQVKNEQASLFAEPWHDRQADDGKTKRGRTCRGFCGERRANLNQTGYVSLRLFPLRDRCWDFFQRLIQIVPDVFKVFASDGDSD